MAKRYLSELLKTLRFESSVADLDISSVDPSLVADKIQEITKKIKLSLGREFLYIFRKDILDTAASYTFGKQIARLKIEEDGKPVELLVDEPKFLSDTFEILKSSIFFNSIKEQFNISDSVTQDDEGISSQVDLDILELQPNPINIQAIKDFAAAHRVVRETLDIEDNSQVKEVNQGEIGFLHQTDPQRYLESIGIGPCIVVVAFNAENKKLGLTHMDGLTDPILTLQNLIERVGVREVSILGANTEPLDKYSFVVNDENGTESVDEECEEPIDGNLDTLLTIKSFLDREDISIKECDILGKPQNIIVDKQTGKIYNVGKPIQRGSDVSVSDVLSRSGKRHVAREIK